ncbi:MAG: radical SAM protein [Eubacteriales bacterium]|nr:radical SAM protein [Eubacteriales bacterium]
MANLMITGKCNLDCPYCFASDYVETEAPQMDEATFRRALDFAMSGSYTRSVGIVGGEPTTHPQLARFLEILDADPRVKRVTLMTNGTQISTIADILARSQKIIALINCNAPGVVPAAAYRKTRENIGGMLNELNMRGRLTLGINLFSPEMDTGYIVDLLREYNLRELRTSIVVPAKRCQTELDALAYFRSMKACVRDLFFQLFAIGVAPFFDCNVMPDCLWADEADFLHAMRDMLKGTANVLAGESRCFPVVDILPDLTAVRCFGLSTQTVQRIEDYATLDELCGYYWRTVDCYACNTCSSGECVDCKQRLHGQCAGGCLAFKWEQIERERTYADTIAREAERRKP